MQRQYWKEIYELKTHIRIIELNLQKAEGIDRFLKIVLAVASSSSIGGWAIWQEYSSVWATIIAGSQVITAINTYLPFKSRVKAYSSLLRELEELMIQAEFKWHAVSEGKLTPTEIHKARFDIKMRKQKSLDKYIPTKIPENETIRTQAEAQARDYLTNFYPA